MKKLSRREFLGRSAIGIGSAVIASQFPLSLDGSVPPRTKKMPVGFQVWTVREQLIKDFPGTLKKMAGLGYQSLEMCSPPGYESSGFGPLMKLKPKEDSICTRIGSDTDDPFQLWIVPESNPE
jgi:hypothetical protein